MIVIYNNFIIKLFSFVSFYTHTQGDGESHMTNRMDEKVEKRKTRERKNRDEEHERLAKLHTNNGGIK